MEGPIRQQLVPIKSVWDRMDRVEERLMEVTVAETPFLTEIAQHLLAAEVTADPDKPNGRHHWAFATVSYLVE